MPLGDFLSQGMPPELADQFRRMVLANLAQGFLGAVNPQVPGGIDVSSFGNAFGNIAQSRQAMLENYKNQQRQIALDKLNEELARQRIGLQERGLDIDESQFSKTFGLQEDRFGYEKERDIIEDTERSTKEAWDRAMERKRFRFDRRAQESLEDYRNRTLDSQERRSPWGTPTPLQVENEIQQRLALQMENAKEMYESQNQYNPDAAPFDGNAWMSQNEARVRREVMSTFGGTADVGDDTTQPPEGFPPVVWNTLTDAEKRMVHELVAANVPLPEIMQSLK